MNSYLKKGLRILRRIGFLVYVVLVVIIIVRAWLLRPKVTLDLMVPAEELNLPLHIAHFPDDINRLLVTEKFGIIKWFFSNSTKAEGILLDIEHKVFAEDWEEGLLSIVFDPKFAENRYYYVFYSLDKPRRSRISRFTMNPDYTTDLESEMILLQVKKKYSGHNGGQLLFGKDNYLYASIGYGSWHKEQYKMLQNRTSLFGSVIRIDVSKSTKKQRYTIPPDNPFVGATDGSRPEIWAYGLRNAWRLSFDRETQVLYAGDVGEITREEINVIKKGGNYGWPKMEGELCFPISEKDDCDKSGMELPLLSLNRFYSRSITGGYVYRGNKIPWLRGKYVFADFLRGISYIEIDDLETMQTTPNILLYKPPTLHGPNKGKIVLLPSFGEDDNGELYVVNLEGGVYRLSDISLIQQLKGFFYQLTNFE